MENQSFACELSGRNLLAATEDKGLDKMDFWYDDSSLREYSKGNLVLKKVAAVHLQACLEETDYLDPLQSGLKPGHGTETSLVTMVSQERDGRSATLLILLGLSPSFSTVDHGIC